MWMRIKLPPSHSMPIRGRVPGASGAGRRRGGGGGECPDVCLRDDAMVIKGISATRAPLCPADTASAEERRQAERATHFGRGLLSCCSPLLHPPHQPGVHLAMTGWHSLQLPSREASSRLSSSTAVGILYPRVTDKRASINHKGVRGKIRKAVLKEFH